MSLRLRSLQTEQSWPLKGGRLLLGRGRGADVLLPPGPEHLVAMLVQYPSGWILHELCAGSPVQVNEEMIRRRRFVYPGDRLHIAGVDFILESRDELEDEDFDGQESTVLLNGPSCTASESQPCRWLHVTVHTPEGGIVERRVQNELLIGRSGHCDLFFPGAAGLARRHLLVANVDGEWYMHDLSGSGIRRNDGRKAPKLVLRDGASGKLGRDLLIAFHLGEQMGEEALEAYGSKSTRIGMHHSTVREPSAPAFMPTAGAAPLDLDSIHGEAAALCCWLAKMRGEEVPPVSAWQKLALVIQLWRARRQKDDAQALTILAECVKQAPFDRDVLLAWARFLEKRDELELCRDVLVLIKSCSSGDALIERALARFDEYFTPV